MTDKFTSNKINVRAIQPEDFNLILELDRQVYPTDSPVTKGTIKNWYKNNPKFGMIFEVDGKIVGVCVAIPLNKEGWDNLIKGKIVESELNEKTLFNRHRDKEIGIHIYHIEKLDKNIKEFYKIVLQDLSKLIKGIKIIGFSGLCVSKEGIDLFEKIGCKERSFKSDEHILEKAGKKFLIKSQKSEEEIKKENKDSMYITRSKMLILYPGEESIVWYYLNSELNIQIIPLNEGYLEEAIDMLNKIFPEQDEEENVDTCFRASLNYEKYKDILKKWEISKLRYFLAIVNNKVVGSSGIYEREGDSESAWAGWTAVAPEYRLRGIGKKLILYIIEKTKNQGYKRLKLHTIDIESQRNAHKLYDSLGFKFISREKEREIGHDRLYYELSLDIAKEQNNKTINKEEEFKKNILKESEEIAGESIKGYDFNSGLDYEKLLDSFMSTGFQATHLAKAIEIIKKMRKDKAFIYLGYTSNIISSGLREVVRYLAEHKLVDVIVTTAGGIEEDFIKCFADFKLGDFGADGTELREKGINRIGNIFVPNSRYVKFENWILPILEKHKNENLTPSKLIRILGQEINNKESVYYWCFKNNIKVFCPAIMDGSLGDMIYFFKFKHPEFILDITQDAVELNNSSLGKEKTGMIILGGGVVKHSICNANLYRNGADYAVYINSQQEFDGSDSGASPEEAKSWGKIKGRGEGESVKVVGDATIIFPILVARAFVD